MVNLAIAEGNKGISIREYAFQKCRSLTSVSIPANVRYIDTEAFAGCTSLSSLTLSYGLLEMRYASFLGCTALQSVAIPNSVIKLEGRVFEGCSALSSLQIPYSVAQISDNNAICGGQVLIQCYPGSAAERYAQKRGNPVQYLQATPSTGIQFQTGTVYMNIDDVKRLAYTLTPANTTDAIVWVSSSPDIVEVNGIGEITAKSLGSVTIIATTTSGQRATVNVVAANKPTEISFPKSSLTVMVGESITQTAVVKDDTGIRKDVKPSYSSSNPSVASVTEAGRVTGHKEGVVTIQAKTGKLSAAYTLTVVSNKPKKISFAKSEKTLIVGRTLTQKAKVMGASGTLKNVKPVYTSSNKKIATVTNTGKVKGLKEGVVVIKAKVGKLTAKYKVKVVMAKLSKKGKTLTVQTIPRAKVTVRASRAVLGRSAKTLKANGRGVAKIKFKKTIKKVTVKVTISKSGYGKKTLKARY